MALSIITADQRLSEKSGVKAVIAGPYAIGKTSLLRTLDATTTLFIDGEAGDLAVQDVECDTMRPLTWTDCRFIAAAIGGPNPAFPDDAVYGAAHHAAAVEMFGEGAFEKYETFFVDGITKLSRICLQWCETQPEGFNDRGMKDMRGAYGLLGREMISWITQLQHVRGKNVILTCAMEQSKDDFGRLSWDPHVEGGKTMRELPGIVDLFISYALIPFPDDQGGSELVRCFVTQKDNQWGFPAKDRSGRLEPIEEPDLAKLIAKAGDTDRRRAAITTTIKQRVSEKAA